MKPKKYRLDATERKEEKKKKTVLGKKIVPGKRKDGINDNDRDGRYRSDEIRTNLFGETRRRRRSIGGAKSNTRRRRGNHS